MRQISICLLIIFFAFLAVSCGPTATEEPTPVPPSATPIPPTPTPTATPIPYDLTVTILDSEGSPIANAVIDIDGVIGTAGEDGAASWENLPGEAITIKVSAPGYFPAEVSQTIERGENQLEVVMDPDPSGLLPANACAPGEKLLYIDDFQDGMAQEWDTVENSAPGWSIEPNPGDDADLVMVARPGGQWAWLGGRETYNLNNSVWRMRFMYTGAGRGHINFRFVESPDFVARYILGLNGQQAPVIRWQPTNEFDIGMANMPTPDEWHLLEFSYYDGTVSVYLDGDESMSWQDPNPWEGGSINLEPMLDGGDAFYFDDMSLCELSAPFEPIPRPKTGYNLMVTLSDLEGNVVPGTNVTVAEMGSLGDATAVSDDMGTAAWGDLPGETATLHIIAPGYFSAQETLTLEKGDNEASLTLERDPFGKLISQACRPEETYLYAEDIQDGKMEGWNQLTSAIEMGAPGYSIIAEPEQENNTILKLEGMSDNMHSNPMGYEQTSFGDAVLRFDVQSFGNIHHIVAWHRNYETGQGYMWFIYGAGYNGGRLEKDLGGNMVTALSWNKYIGDGKWHTFEISTYQGEVQLWIDGRYMAQWADQQPIEEGVFTIEHDFWKGGSYAHYDNFAVCGLNAPFVSIFAEE